MDIPKIERSNTSLSCPGDPCQFQKHMVPRAIGGVLRAVVFEQVERVVDVELCVIRPLI
jgi:hypothetical protein